MSIKKDRLLFERSRSFFTLAVTRKSGIKKLLVQSGVMFARIFFLE